ncbi:glycine cleavage system aminomethyltransferase GcvT [Kineosporia rhizophila]|uniref:glycine cleavage system aminomethyltransferase GcvT n=1 Tax=Kineosporia TaxID=49184 RepID=UPI001E309F7A|nr:MULTISPECIES: glycine cleavage system aminomethyltransferase GcvT [Kineosporia]MCE0538272.1 glycine cleavage system aminomethyltransferase GcvT [Kineosporia rhizophila]GLY18671.1 aminomethyltransferase [Kineosporia sp. NBRC 101677]
MPEAPQAFEVGGTNLRRTPLYERHRALGAKLADFGGWEMPIEYAAGGVLKEHEAVRERVGVFDVSHLGKIEVRGQGAVDFVNDCLTNDLHRIGPGQAQYTVCCDPQSGGVVDDLIVYIRSEDDVLLVPNAANCAEVARRLTAAAPPELEVSDRHDGYGVIAVQGPKADQTLAALGLPAGQEYMSFVDVIWQGLPLIVCRTGYTGERGYELLPAWEVTPALWDRLVEAAQEWDGLPCGLGARDTLRTEMGYALHGHELTMQITPVQARLGWAVGWKKPRFWGREALLAEKEAGPRRVSRGLVALGRGVPRAEMDVLDAQQNVVGRTTSGTFSPTLKQGIALALLDPSVPEGDEVTVSVRGRPLACKVVRPPFVGATTREN